MDGIFDLATRTYPTADEAFRGVLTDLVSDAPVSGATTSGPGEERGSTHERIGYGFVLEDMRNRIVASGLQTLNVKVAVARFVWMISGNNRLADIAFYEPKVGDFTDDGIVVPGSSYGHRMRYAAPGIDQLTSVIRRLQDDLATRRAGIAVYHPTDATRESKDIPCLFGLMFHARQSKLHATVVMRSNNAFRLLPFNLFELTMLAEVVAAEVGLELGSLRYFAGSMHLYSKDLVGVRDGLRDAGACKALRMPEMPRDPEPMGEIAKLVRLEAEIRQGSAGIRAHTMGEWIDKVRDGLHPYWQQFAFLLLATIAERNQDARASDKVKAVLSKEFKTVTSWKPSASATPAASIPTDLFGEAPAQDNAPSMASVTRGRLARRFSEIATDRERRTGKPLEAAILLTVRDRFFERLAARGADDVITEEEFELALKEAETERGRDRAEPR